MLVRRESEWRQTQEQGWMALSQLRLLPWAEKDVSMMQMNHRSSQKFVSSRYLCCRNMRLYTFLIIAYVARIYYAPSAPYTRFGHSA